MYSIYIYIYIYIYMYLSLYIYTYIYIYIYICPLSPRTLRSIAFRSRLVTASLSEAN